MKGTVLIQGTSYQITLPNSLTLFTKKIKEEFKDLVYPYRIQYKDMDNDSITVITDEDYKIAIEDMKDSGLYFTIVELDDKLQFTDVKSTYISNYEHKSQDGKEDVKDLKEECSSYKEKDEKHEVSKETKLISTLKEHLEEKLKKDLNNMIQEEVRKSFMNQSNMLNSLMTNLSQSSLIKKSVICSICGKEISPGESVYHCLLCPNFYSCEKCEEANNHEHSLAKGKRAGERIEYQMKIVNSSNAEIKIEPNAIYTKVWTLKNTGKSKWPENMELKSIEGDNFKVEISEIESILPENHCDILIKFKAPMVKRKYKQVFQLEGRGIRFGEKIVVELEVVHSKDLLEKDKSALINKRIEKLKNLAIYEEKYKENLRRLLECKFDLDELGALRLLKDNDNNLDEVLKKLHDKDKG